MSRPLRVGFYTAAYCSFRSIGGVPSLCCWRYPLVMSREPESRTRIPLGAPSAGKAPGCRDHAAERVAHWIVRGTNTDEDPRTLKLWGRVAGASTRTLQYGCSAAALSPAACRDLTRLLRLVLRAIHGEWDPLGCLNADPRTIRRLAMQSGLGMKSAPHDLHQFLSTQTLVRNPHVLSALEAEIAMSDRPREATRSDGRGDPGAVQTPQ